MLPEVVAAMEAAARHFVNINELMAGASVRIAELTGAPSGIVTCGSAAAIALATAAAIAGNDPIKMLALPFTGGMVRRVVMPKSHRFPYDQAIRMVGAEIAEVETLAELEALDFSTIAMVAIVGSRDFGTPLSIEDLVRVARPHGVPVLVDAASEHIRRPNPWLERGADLVVYSGGKFLRGPQTSGLLIGRRDLINSAWANSSPHRAFGRPMKVGKEDVIGVLTALELWFRRDKDASHRAWQEDLNTIAGHVALIDGCRAEMLPPDHGDEQPQLKLSWSRDRVAVHGMELRRQLLEGTPRIMLDDMSAGEGSIVIEPFSLQPGESEMVGKAIAAALVKSRNEPVQASTAPPIDVSGNWVVDVDLLRWPRRHSLSLHQDESILTGTHSASALNGAVSGTVDGDKVYFEFEGTFEAAIVTFRFSGEVVEDTMQGTVDLGSATPGTRGVVSYTQYGQAAWRAVKQRDIREPGHSLFQVNPADRAR